MRLLRAGLSWSRAAWNAAFGAPHKRETARYSLLRRVSVAWGFRLYQQNARWFEDEDFIRVWEGFPDPANTIHDRRFNLYGLARSISHIPGDLVECGVYRGRGSHLMLKATEGTGKHLYGFDSFEGLSEPSAEDLTAPDALQWSSNTFASDEDIARSNLAIHSGRYTLLKGWIPERFAEVADNRFCMVHIDVDLYQPTRDSLAFFYDRLSRGGIIVCDDYGSVACPGAKAAVDEFAASLGRRPAALATGQAILQRGDP
jgi:O-methyltransferase